MPVSFAPASPLGNSNVSYEYGKMQQSNQNVQFRQQAQQAAWQQGDRMASLQAQAQAQAQQQAQFEASQQPSQRDMYLNDQHAAQTSNNINQQIQGQMAEQQQRFTQADELRLQRLQAGRSALTAAVSSGAITQQDADQAMPFITAETGALEVLRTQEQNRLTRQQENRTAQLSAAAAARARADEKHLAQGGPETHDIRNPETGEVTTMYRTGGRNSAWTPLAPGGGGTRSTGAGGAAPQPAVDVNRIISDVRGETTQTPDGRGPRYATEDAVQAEVSRRLTTNQQILDQTQPQIQEQRQLQPRGPIPGGMPQLETDPATGKVRSPFARVTSDNISQSVGHGIVAAEQAHDLQASRDLRGAAVALNSGRNTGQLNPQQQERLRQIGYYSGQFTPDVDRELSSPRYDHPSREESGRSTWGDMVNPFFSSQGATTQERLPPDPGLETMRRWLSQYKSRDNMPPATQREFDQLRTALVLRRQLPSRFTDWPPTPPPEPRQTGNSTPEGELLDNSGIGGGADYAAAPGF